VLEASTTTGYIERYISNVISQCDGTRGSILMWQALLARPVTGGGPGLIPYLLRAPPQFRTRGISPRAVNDMPRSVWMLVGGPPVGLSVATPALAVSCGFGQNRERAGSGSFS
jgi:hypothetical protein